MSRSHTLINPADRECSPCRDDCPGCEEERQLWLAKLKAKYNSDKFYWHRYIDFYEEKCFSRFHPRDILEFGVLAGESIRYLDERFPLAVITGVDKDDAMDGWPFGENIHYFKLNQGNRGGLYSFFRNKSFDLVIDDGSHEPEHQAWCLITAFPSLTKKGFYIVEDIHSNLGVESSLLNVLLAIERVHSLGKNTTGKERVFLANHLTEHEIAYLDENIAELHFYSRSVLPLRCHACKKEEIDYSILKCLSCGEDMYSRKDSMSVIVRKK